MFGDNATLVSSFGTPFLMTLENFGYTAATNPYIVYIRYMLANNYGLKDRRQFLAVYQAYAGKRKDLPQQTTYNLKTNILYNIDLYNQSADDMYNYLLLQRKADDVKIDKNNNSKLFDL